ncbi:MAG: LytTR family transcriptional regulator DNA-binding domain-containing protein [Granulosicoccus sp.]|nr:LytTR family transcriptional regulator DNA-binding domain-containing protein [Granulosicoccus sp.]
MIDSSGRRALRADGTVLDLMPIGQAIAIFAVLLVVLFTLIKPEASNGLGHLARMGFWTLHVVLGLVAIWVASRWLATGEFLPTAALARVLLTGLAGVLIASPGYLLLDALYDPYVIDLDPDPEAPSVLLALVKETVDLTPWFLATWILINLPVLLPSPNLTTQLDDNVSHEPVPPSGDRANTDNTVTVSPEDVSESAPELTLVKNPPGTSASAVATNESLPSIDAKVAIAELADAAPRPTTPQVNQRSQRFLSTLPGVVGTDVIAVANDLHYLNVWTTAGRTTVLGNLRDVVADLGDIGLQVHRSHWVAHAHVRRILGTASNGVCILSNELRVPISRRRWKDVRKQYGRGVVHTSSLPFESNT